MGPMTVVSRPGGSRCKKAGQRAGGTRVTNFRPIPRKPALFSTFPAQLPGHSAPGCEQAYSPLTAVGSSVVQRQLRGNQDSKTPHGVHHLEGWVGSPNRRPAQACGLLAILFWWLPQKQDY